ncbi:sigma-70 family RNA polymerase sigma factor [Salipaludibacillus sp. HK11]|uniref:sigma-70 family RNA polymerase sigma factor n=1 Tax=Salipaludibacillus sp. HK11 TaxID=3394320 RepID=UPI0039FC7165
MSQTTTNEYVQRYEKELLNFFNGRVANRFDAEDLLQDMWLKVFINQETFLKVDNTRAWLFQIARNIIIDFYRKKQLEIPTDLITDRGLFENVQLFNSTNFNEECTSYLLSELSKLPQKYKLPIQLHIGGGWKHQQISSHLNLSLSGSKTRVQRAKRNLKKTLLNCCHVEVDIYGNIIRYESKSICCAS